MMGALTILGALIVQPALAGPYLYSHYNEPDSTGDRNYSFGINDSGQIVGEYGDAYGPSEADWVNQSQAASSLT
jgi:hypothetical protein